MEGILFQEPPPPPPPLEIPIKLNTSLNFVVLKTPPATPQEILICSQREVGIFSGTVQ